MVNDGRHNYWGLYGSEVKFTDTEKSKASQRSHCTNLLPNMLTECTIRTNYRPIQKYLGEAQGRQAWLKTGTWDPIEHWLRVSSGSNSHLRHNIKIYLRLNSTVSLLPDQSVKVFPLLHLMLSNHCLTEKLPFTTQKTVCPSIAKKMCRSLIILKM